jgi:hypothetical protein
MQPPTATACSSFRRRSASTVADKRARTSRRRGRLHPDRERRGNYDPTILGRRYDAFVFCDRSNAVTPLHMTTADVRDA